MGSAMPRGRQLGAATFLRRWVGSFAMLAAFAGGATWAAPPEPESAQKPAPKPAQKPVVDPQARALLEKMSDFLANQRQFSVQTDGSIEVVLESGEKLEFDYSSDVLVKRPDKLRSDRRGEKTDAEFYYDGRTFTLYGKNKHYYASADAPGTLDEAIDAARERLGIEAPAADLLYSNPFKILMEDVVSATDLGPASVRGVSCRHLAFRGNETDWQIWIQDGPKPLPIKFVIVSKKVQGLPEYTVEFSDWNLSRKLGDEVFHFSPRGNDQRIDFVDKSKPSPEKQGDTK